MANIFEGIGNMLKEDVAPIIAWWVREYFTPLKMYGKVASKVLPKSTWDVINNWINNIINSYDKIVDKGLSSIWVDTTTEQYKKRARKSLLEHTLTRPQDLVWGIVNGAIETPSDIVDLAALWASWANNTFSDGKEGAILWWLRKAQNWIWEKTDNATWWVINALWVDPDSPLYTVGKFIDPTMLASWWAKWILTGIAKWAKWLSKFSKISKYWWKALKVLSKADKAITPVQKFIHASELIHDPIWWVNWSVMGKIWAARIPWKLKTAWHIWSNIWSMQLRTTAAQESSQQAYNRFVDKYWWLHPVENWSF